MAGVVMLLDVRLPIGELQRAGHHGLTRHARALYNRNAPAHGVAVDDWRAHVLGAWGECVVARVTDHYWPTDVGPDRGSPDVGPWHVRTRAHADDELIIRERDADGGPFVLVVLVRLPVFRIVGWCYGHEGKRAEWWTDHGNGRPPAYFVPHTPLRPFDAALNPVTPV
jgi:hypothetical protein